MDASDTYRFHGQEEAYDLHRPRWNVSQAWQTLATAGITFKDGKWLGTLNEGPPVIGCIGSGTGSDPAVFKAIGCKVYVVEPNEGLLQKAEDNLNKIPSGEAIFLAGYGADTGIPEQVDVLVAAQALHTLKSQFSGRPKDETNIEELTRQHWKTLLPDDGRARVSAWYYNPDPRLPVTQILHALLTENCPEYAQSKTPLLNAEFFDPKHFQPWMAAQDMQVTDLMDVQKLDLKRNEIKSWLSSYSFKPSNEEELDSTVRILQEEWFDQFCQNGTLFLSYVGAITQAKLRSDAFPIKDLDKPVSVKTPLMVSPVQPAPASNATRPQLVFMSGLVCDKPVLQDIMNQLDEFGDVRFIDYFKPEFDTMDRLCDACHDEILALDPDRPIVLITFSMGGYISPLLLEKMHREGTASRISAICGIESTPYADLPARQEQRNELLKKISQGNFAEVVDTVVTRDWYLPDVVQSRPDIIEESRQMILDLGPDVFAAQTAAIRDRSDVTEKLRHFTMPVLTISAQRSNLFAAPDPRHGKTPVEALNDAIPSGDHKTVIIPDAGHLVPRTHPEAVTREIKTFLKANNLIFLREPEKSTSSISAESPATPSQG